MKSLNEAMKNLQKSKIVKENNLRSKKSLKTENKDVTLDDVKDTFNNLPDNIKSYLENTDNVPTKEIEGTLWFDITQEEKEQLEQFVNYIDTISEDVWRKWDEKTKLDMSSYANNADRICKNCTLKLESKDPTYIVCSYYDEKLHGLEDELKTDDWSEVEDFAHRKLMQGNMLEIENTKTGKYRRINPDEYDETFDGEFIVRPEELEEAKENNLKSKKSLKTESKFDKVQATLPLDNFHSMGIIVSDDGETVQYMYSNDENSIYESEIEYDEEGRPYFKDEEGETWYIDEFMRTDYPKTVKEMKQDAKTKSNDNAIVIKTGLSDEKAQDILDSVIGQMSDGIWENSSRMNRYWKYADIIKEGSEIAIKISYPNSYENGFKGKSENEIKKFFAQKIKQIVKEEELNWDRNNEERSCYLDRHSGVTVKDAYRVYDKLLGRRERITEANQDEYNYMLLDRLKQDCEYYLGNGNRNAKHLWAGNVDGQIAKMKELYNKLPKKPEWLSMKDIENYEKEMKQNTKADLNESLEMNEDIKTKILDYLNEYNIENLMDYGSDEDAIGGMNSISEMFKDILDILKIKYVNVSTVDGISDGKYVTTIDFGNKTLDLDIRASEEKDDILEDVKTIIDFCNNKNENLTEDVGTMTPDEYILRKTKKALLDRGLDIDLLHETCSEFGLAESLRTTIHYILNGINFSINEYVYGDFDVTLDNKLNLSIDMFEDLDEDKEINKSTITITPAERKILNAVKVVSSKYDLSNIKIETTRKGNTHIMSTKGEDIVTIGPLTDDEKEDLRLNGYYINN